MTEQHNPPTIRVTKVPGGDDWRVKRDGAQRSIAITDTQAQADAIARRVARNSGGAEVITQGEDGRIRSKDSVGGQHDPNPPKDNEH